MKKRVCKTKKNNKSRKIFYTGIGSKKSGMHNNEEFLKAMQSESIFVDQCPKFIAGKSCKPCKKYRKRLNKTFKKLKKNITYNLSDKEIKKQNELLMNCVKCKQTNQKIPCTLEEYMEYSGATYRK